MRYIGYCKRSNLYLSNEKAAEAARIDRGSMMASGVVKIKMTQFWPSRLYTEASPRKPHRQRVRARLEIASEQHD